MTSPQTLSLADRMILSAWAADCAERVLGCFEREAPDDARPREAIMAAKAFACGEIGAAEMIRRRGGGKGPQPTVSKAADAAARSAGQALAVAHMGAHSLGAAGYASQAIHLAAAHPEQAWRSELAWQVAHMTPQVNDALLRLPLLGEGGGPLGPGLLSKGLVGESIRRIQSALPTRQPAGE